MKRHFHTLDVFTGRPFAGNPLAVVHDSAGLDTPAMQAIAREFNLSETVFVLPPADPANTAALRIFTPAAELPFAGHPTVGAGVLIATLRAPDRLGGAGITVALEERIGLVRVDVTRREGRAARGVFALPRLPERLPGAPDAAMLAGLVGLAPADIVTDVWSPAVFSAGVPYLVVPVASREALTRARPPATLSGNTDRGEPGLPALFLVAADARDPAHHFDARMFAPQLGVAEDPATGSAAAAFAGAIMAFTPPPDGGSQFVIEQGYAMGRPSEIVLTLEVQDGVLAGATIGGEAVIVSEGWIEA
jgi:trans-2,3-dihydro-3-hydroxyanthranilate isomerase